MLCKVLINDTVKRFLLEARPALRRQLRKSFEFLENGLWEGGLRIKKLRGLSRKTVLEGRVGRGDRILLTLGRDADETGTPLLLAYVWAVVPHDLVDAQARAILPHNAPFLSFTEFEARHADQVEIEKLDDSCFTQEPITERAAQETGCQRWFILDDEEWRRLLLYSEGDFDIFLYLTPEQRELLKMTPPLLLSGTAGSGKTTLSIYYLLHPHYIGRPRLFLTYNRHLRNFSERLYRSLVQATDRADSHPPDFLTFRDLCLRLVPDPEARFAAEREVDLPVFRELLARHRWADKYDPALVWEEIRSIIKGAKPQLDARVLRRLVADLEGGLVGAPLVRDLREEILALRNLGLSEKADAVARRIMSQGLTRVAADLPEHAEKHRPSLVRTLHALLDVVDKHEANFAAPLMTFAEYERLGRKRAPVFLQDRKEIYSVAEWYQGKLQADRLWDEIDLTRAAVRSMDAGAAQVPPYDLVCCDEVQDFTDIQLSMIVRVPRDPGRLLLAGDPKQIVNPSGFRWEEAKDLFYDRGIPVPPVHHLTLNFRCVGSIVLLANALLKLKQQLLGVRSDERLDDWKFQGRPPFLVRGISPEEFLDNLQITAADRTILTRTPGERDFLKQRLETELVFTIREAKGLEFRTVVLWKFCSDPVVGDMWARIINAETAALHDHQIRHEINLLYVGITRAQQDLILYDGPDASAIWSSPLFEDLLHHSATLDFLDEAWRATSSPEDWKRQGDYFLDHEHYRAAAECFRNANRPDLMARAKAQAHEKLGEHETAGQWWLKAGEDRRAAEAFERGGRPGLAFPLWEALGEKGRALDCRIRQLETERRFEEAAELRETRKEYEKAVENWRQANRHDRAAALLERIKKPLEAARAYRAARDFQNAARLFLKVKDFESAARCLEDARHFVEAAKIWKRLRKPDDVQRCLVRSGDPILLGEHYESRQEWDRAIDCYRRALGPELRNRFENESRTTPRRKVDHARRALRLELVGAPRGVGEAWEKAGLLNRAAAAFSKEQNFQAAGRCLERQKQYLEAIGMFARSPEDRVAHSRALQRCIWRGGLAQWYSGRSVAVESLARSLRKAREFEAASAVFAALHRRSEAAECLALGGDADGALRLWSSVRDVDSILRYTRETKQFAKGAAAVGNILELARNERDLTQASVQGLETLLGEWWAAEKSEDSRVKIAEAIKPHAFYMSLKLVSEILQPLGWYDEILDSARYGPGEELPSRKRKNLERTRKNWVERARELEQKGHLSEAGLWYLCGERAGDARRCWADLQPNDHNHRCLADAGFARRVADYHLARGDTRNAALALFRGGEPKAGAELFLQMGDPLSAGLEFEISGLFEEAAGMYLRGGDRPRAARMYEKGKKYAEAAALYKELGETRRYERCAKKVGSAVQLTFLERSPGVAGEPLK